MHHSTIDIWSGLTYLGEGPDGFRPVLETYVLKGAKQRPAVLIFPGGGYQVTSPRESEPIAIQFAAAGYHAFVLHYSVNPRRHPLPILDASRAMCIIRENAEAWRVDPDKIAVCGFSAGGHLAASLGVHWDKEFATSAAGIEPGMNRPNALILCYPVITRNQFAHRGSFVNLLGKDADQQLLDLMSLDMQVSEKTPPTFLWHTYEDQSVPVENSLLFAAGLRKHRIPFEMHIYPKGRHGLSTATPETCQGDMIPDPHVATWMGLCIEWLDLTFGRG